ncbi:MAG TPA: 2OG-Fe(II) oxygenase [Cellvibrio sp.]|nr:2OG-Fe(II) oxygenase [Cellvibrio sp.]
MLNISDALLNDIANALVEPGYIVLDQIMAPELIQALQQHFAQLGNSEFKRAGIGRQADFQLQDNVRSDEIYWLDKSAQQGEESVIAFLAWMEALRSGLNQRLFLGLFDYESHFASYAAGAFYKKHLDTFKGSGKPGQARRVLSTVVYLNDEWREGEGGELILYSEDGEQVLQRLMPSLGRMIIFLSEKFPHEVLPARRARKSIAGWFRVNSIS